MIFEATAPAAQCALWATMTPIRMPRATGPQLGIAFASKPILATKRRALIASRVGSTGSGQVPQKRLGRLPQRAHGILSQIPERFPFKPWLNGLRLVGTERL